MNIAIKILIAFIIGVLVTYAAGLVLSYTVAVLLGIVAGVCYLFYGDFGPRRV